MRSAIMREDTAILSVVRPETLLVDDDAVLSARARAERDGHNAGYAAGLAEGQGEMQAVADKARSEQSSALKALESAVARAKDVLETEHVHLEHAAVELAFQIAQAVLTRELQLSSSPGLEAISRALAESPESEGAVVRMNPADAEALAGLAQSGETITIIPDPAVGAGGCILEVGAALVDARIEAALERVRKVLDEAIGES
ncbi:MAG: FliH/SctL family protein [Acidimicrobiales bacterium]|jgi:flagellar assembly protein FliH